MFYSFLLFHYFDNYRRVVGKNKNRGRNAEGNQKQKRRRNKYRAQKSNVSVNVLAPEVATQEEAIGDGNINFDTKFLHLTNTKTCNSK